MKKKQPILCAMVLLALLSGCSAPSGSSSTSSGAASTVPSSQNSASLEQNSGEKGSLVTAPGEFPIVNQPVTLSVFVASTNTNVVEPQEDNYAVNFFEEKTGVHIDWEVVVGSSDQVAQRTNLKFASNDLPDVFSAKMTKTMQMQYGGIGAIIPLNDLIDQYGYYINEAFKETPQAKTQFTAPDGNIYGLGSISEFYHGMYPCKMWVNQNWLSKLGLNVPTTTDEFRAMLEAFRDRDPNGNGKQDEIPLASNGTHIFTYLLNSFIYTPPGDDAWANNPGYAYQDNGKIVYIGDKEEYREGLRYISGLFKDKLIAEDTLTMGSSQLKALGMADEVILGASAELFPGEFTVGRAEGDRFWEYVSIPPLTGPNGLKQAPERLFTYSGSDFSISRTCANPEVAMRWVDWFYTLEGTATWNYGMYHEEFNDKCTAGWTYGKEGEVGADGKQAVWMRFNAQMAETDPTFKKTDGAGMYQVLPMYMPLKNHTGQTILVPEFNNDIFLYNQTNSNYAPYGVNKTIPDMFVPDEYMSEFTELKNLVETETSKWMASFAVGVSDLDSDWDTYITTLKSMGLDRYVELYQLIYDANQH